MKDGEEVLTSEGIVKLCYSAKCIREGVLYSVYADSIKIGESEFSPLDAWDNASENLPYDFVKVFEESSEGRKLTTEKLFRRKNEDYESRSSPEKDFPPPEPPPA